ncbi:MAG: hypothetical protein PHY31_05700, partial [Smithellaceae bacterium]|nr:hypothetical protein [Smithellaceae bacterium]
DPAQNSLSSDAKMKTILIYVAAWLGMVVIAVINGTLRVKGYGPYMDELTAHQISTFTGIILFSIYIWLIMRKWPLTTAAQAAFVGALWLFLTVTFEFGFGHYAMGHPWEELLHDYNIFAGRLWSFILVWTAVAPYLFYRLRSR